MLACKRLLQLHAPCEGKLTTNLRRLIVMMLLALGITQEAYDITLTLFRAHF